MKKLFLVILAVVFVTFSCGKGKNTENTSFNEDKKTTVKKDSVKQEKKEESVVDIKKYNTPENKTVYVDVLPENKAIVDVAKLKDWIEKDVNNYLDLSYSGSNKGDLESEEILLEKSKDGKLVAKYKLEKGEITMKDVKIEGNKFYSILTINNVSEEFNGKFVMFKAPVKGESDFIYGLLINRKGVWKFFYQFV